MLSKFQAFPSIPHVAWLGGAATREDKVLSPADAELFLQHPVLVEEKVDGANLGLSFDEHGTLQAQNRGGYLPEPWSGQFSKLRSWLEPKQDSLFDVLGTDLVLFGEWCTVKHSLHYTSLTDWFLVFDVFDCGVGQYLTVRRRNDVAAKCGLALVPELARGKFTLSELKVLLADATSCFYSGPPEGLMLRSLQTSSPVQRAKLVRTEFVQAISEHWRSRLPVPNRLNQWGSQAHV